MSHEAETERLAPTVRPLNWPPMEVEVDVSPEQLARMIARVEACFSNVKYEAPFRVEADKDFVAAGRGQLSLLKVAADRCGISLDSVTTCLELGCGHGRGTIALSERFPKVIAADVSGPHVAVAADNAGRLGRQNITFVHANKINSLGDLPGFDLFFSKFALQHSPPPVISHVLKMILAKLNPGGLCYFQISVFQLGYKFNAEKYLSVEPNFAIPEMHMLPQPYLFRILEQYGCRLLEIREDDSAGKRSISFHLLARKLG